MHFGHCDRFALLDVDETSGKTGETTLLIPPSCEPSAIPRWLRQQDADAIITGEMGRRAQQLFGENGIQVVGGASPDAPEDAVSAYLSGSLVVGNHPCQQNAEKFHQ